MPICGNNNPQKTMENVLYFSVDNEVSWKLMIDTRDLTVTNSHTVAEVDSTDDGSGGGTETTDGRWTVDPWTFSYMPQEPENIDHALFRTTLRPVTGNPGAKVHFWVKESDVIVEGYKCCGIVTSVQETRDQDGFKKIDVTVKPRYNWEVGVTAPVLS